MKINYFFFVLILVISCDSSQENLSPNSSPQSGVNQTISVGFMDSQRIPTLTIKKSDIKNLLFEDSNIKSVEYTRTYYTDKNLLVLESGGPTTDGKYVTIGTVLIPVEHEDGVVALFLAPCKQKCTSVAPCEGCTLTIISDCSGSCSCSSGWGGSCTHTVETQN